VYDAAHPSNELLDAQIRDPDISIDRRPHRGRPRMTSRPLAVIALLAVMVVWGSTFVVTKAAMAELPPLTMAFVRVSIGTLVLVPFAIPRMRASHSQLPWRWIWLMGVVGVALYYVVFNSSLQYTSASQGALVQSSIPAVTAMIAVLWLREAATRMRVVGIVLSIIGVLIVFAGGNTQVSDAAPAPVLGNLLMFASVVCWGWYTSLAKRVADNDAIVITTWVTAIGAALLLPLSIAELWGRDLPNPSMGAWLGVAYLGVFASGAGYVLYNYALKGMAASQVGVFTNLIPIVGVLTGIIALGEPLAWQAIVGGIIVMLGVWMTSRS
jgi:drug/metabolite transporter (DMT)-like permease